MLNVWRPCLAVLLGAGLIWAGQGAPAQAQAALSVETLVLEVWPEFDRASALVLISGTLSAGTGVPAQVTVRIPAAASGPHAAAYQDATGSLLSAPYNTATEGDWIRVTITVQAPNFHLEYYDPALTVAGEARTLAFNWVSDYAVRALTVRVQEPAGARNLRLEPAFTAAGSGDYGLNYYAREWGGLAAGQTVSFTLQYAKTSAALSTEVISPAARPVTVDSPAPASAAPNWSVLSPWIIGAIAGAALAVGGAGWLIWRRSAASDGAGRTRRGRRRTAREPAPVPVGDAVSAARFCTQCGQPVSPEDRFCRNCGAPQASGS